MKTPCVVIGSCKTVLLCSAYLLSTFLAKQEKTHKNTAFSLKIQACIKTFVKQTLTPGEWIASDCGVVILSPTHLSGALIGYINYWSIIIIIIIDMCV